jgi:hypothetical protein
MSGELATPTTAGSGNVEDEDFLNIIAGMTSTEVYGARFKLLRSSEYVEGPLH